MYSWFRALVTATQQARPTLNAVDPQPEIKKSTY